MISIWKNGKMVERLDADEWEFLREELERRRVNTPNRDKEVAVNSMESILSAIVAGRTVRDILADAYSRGLRKPVEWGELAEMGIHCLSPRIWMRPVAFLVAVVATGPRWDRYRERAALRGHAACVDESRVVTVRGRPVRAVVFDTGKLCNTSGV